MSPCKPTPGLATEPNPALLVRIGQRQAPRLAFELPEFPGFRVLGLRVLGLRVLGLRVLGFRVLGFRVWGLGFRA